MKKAFLITVILFSFSLAQENLTLNDAIAIALENNYNIRVTKSDQRVAEIQNAWGSVGLFPTIDLSVGNNRSWTDTNAGFGDNESERLQGGVDLKWLLFDGFSVHIRKSQLNLFEDLSAGNTAAVVEQTIQDVILAYYTVLLDREKRQVAETLMQLSEDRFNYQSERQQLGSQTTYDVLQAQNSFLEDKGRFMLQDVAYKNAIRNLNFLMAKDPGTMWSFTAEFSVDPKQYDVSTLQDKMLSSNRTLKNQYISQKLLEKNVSLSRADWSPTLALGAGYDNWDNESTYDKVINLVTGSKSSSVFSKGYSVGLNLSWSLFNGGNRHRAVQIAKIDRETGETQIENIKHTLSNQLYNFYEIHLVRQELLNVADEALQTAQLNLDISEEKFKSGAINSFNFRDVQLLYLNSAVNRLDAIYAYIDVDTALMRLTGGIISQYE